MTQQSSPPGFSSPKTLFKSYVLPLALLVFLIGGTAWVAQNHRFWNPKTTVPHVPDDAIPKTLEFLRVNAQWDKDEKKNFKEFETGGDGHYDFPFKNDSDQAVEVGLRESSCDCASVAICLLPYEEWQRVEQAQRENPGATLPYRQEPAWHTLAKFDPLKKSFKVQAREYGIVRVNWHTRKPSGQMLNLKPSVWWHPVGNAALGSSVQFFIPGAMTTAVRVYPMRHDLREILETGGSGKAEFYLWSPTRENLDLDLLGPAPDPLFVPDPPRLLTDKEKNELQEKLLREKIPSRVLSAYLVTVRIYERKDNNQLDQGSFFRKLPIYLNHSRENLPELEIAGRVRIQGDIQIGGADDQGRIRFKSFDSSADAVKVVELATDAEVDLEPSTQHPATLKVQLKLDKKNTTPRRKRWQLKVTVPANTFYGTFSEADAVTLRIAGDPPRFVRIPLEGESGKRE